MRILPPEVVEAFWSKVDIQDRSECWHWAGILNQGYGVFWMPGRKRIRAHRLAFELVRGELPGGLVTDHLCRNRKCVNPYHVELVTNKENVLRGVGITAQNKAKTHCKNGHEFTPENTVACTRAGGGASRECRICRIEKTRRWRAKKSSAAAIRSLLTEE